MLTVNAPTTPASSPFHPIFLREKYTAGLDYEAYLATDAAKSPAWRKIEAKLSLSSSQQNLIASFSRQLHVICLSGIWCGDCSSQGPLLHRIALANPDKIDLKFLDRDEHMDLAQRVMINAGLRVPTVIFMAEDFEFLGLLGDRTLSRYRAVAAKQLGASCPLPGAEVPQDELNATLQDWVNEFERIHLMLRLSARLRQKHGD